MGTNNTTLAAPSAAHQAWQQNFTLADVAPEEFKGTADLKDVKAAQQVKITSDEAEQRAAETGGQVIGYDNFFTTKVGVCIPQNKSVDEACLTASRKTKFKYRSDCGLTAPNCSVVNADLFNSWDDNKAYVEVSSQYPKWGNIGMIAGIGAALCCIVPAAVWGVKKAANAVENNGNEETVTATEANPEAVEAGVFEQREQKRAEVRTSTDFDRYDY